MTNPFVIPAKAGIAGKRTGLSCAGMPACIPMTGTK
jgi:hypothetical protein